LAKDLGPEDADPEKTLDADEDLDETLPYSLPYEYNDKDEDNNNIGYRVQWEPLNGSLVETSDSETEEDGGELCTHRFNSDKEPAPFSTSFVKDEGEEEAPDSLQPVAPEAETQQVVETPIITRVTVTAKRATFSIRASGRFWRQGLVGANAKSSDVHGWWGTKAAASPHHWPLQTSWDSNTSLRRSWLL